VCEIVGCFADIQFKHSSAGLNVWKGNEDTSFEPSTNCTIELPWNICCSQYQNSTWIISDSLFPIRQVSVEGQYIHLYEEFSFDTSRGFTFTFSSCSTDRIHLINEYDRRLILSCHRKQLFHQPRLSFDFIRTYLSLSPIHLLIRSLELTEKKVELASVATAFARNDFPVPGGP
jgi:hypothetical protein